MVGLYRPKILLIRNSNGEYLEQLFSNEGISYFLAKNIQEANNQLEQANIDMIIAVLDKENSNIPAFFKKLSHNLPIIIVEDQTGGIVPKAWRERSDIFLTKKTAKESLIKICYDLIEQRVNGKKAA